jgi:hypothetical protein
MAKHAGYIYRSRAANTREMPGTARNRASERKGKKHSVAEAALVAGSSAVTCVIQLIVTVFLLRLIDH